MKDFSLEILKWPDTAVNEALFLDCYKWLHPDYIRPPMPSDEGGLKDPLPDPDGVTFPPDSAPVLLLCSVYHSSLKTTSRRLCHWQISCFLVPSQINSRI
jgi:hypothetical protein